MPPPDLAGSPETPQDPIEIRDEDAITIHQALAFAHEQSFQLGKSTLQRWTKYWKEHPRGAVRCVLVDTSAGRFYKLSRDDFEAWVFEQKQNDKSRETPRDLKRPQEVLQDLPRPREISRDAEDNNRIKELENENMQLKIDVGVRKQLLEQAKGEMERLNSLTINLARENGSLQYQIHQLAAPAPKREAEAPAPGTTVDNSSPGSEMTGV